MIDRRLSGCFGHHGWREFYRNRRNILDEFDKLFEQTASRPVQTAHGRGVEAYIRKWLSEFLPRKYGVTSGYIIPDLYGEGTRIYHFDIIIYDAINAPVLWTEGTEDDSDQGKHRAIPAKHVMAVYEVKSRLTKRNAEESLAKLKQVNDFKEQLNPNYFSGAIFIDLMDAENRDSAIVRKLHSGIEVFGFRGGMVLRYEGDGSITGLISLSVVKSDTQCDNETPPDFPLAKPIDDLNIYITEDGNLQLAEAGAGARLVATSPNNWSVSKTYGTWFGADGYLIQLDWSKGNFSEFCIDLISALEGLPYNDKNRPSFGRIFDDIPRKKAAAQSGDPLPGLPFLDVRLSSNTSCGKALRISSEDENATIEFTVEVENQGDTPARFSDDTFQTSCTIGKGQRATKIVKINVSSKDSNVSVDEILNGDGVEFPYRIVYETADEPKQFVAVERMIKISGGEIRFIVDNR